MRKTFLLFVFAFVLLSFIRAEEVEYHFQEGFAKGRPTGWKGNNSSTTTCHVTDPPYSFAQTNASKFDKDYANGINYLETPSYSGAGVLSFYIARAAVKTYMDLLVYQISGTDTTLIYQKDLQTVSHKDAAWDYITIPLHTQKTVSLRFAATVKDINVGWFAIDDMELTKYSGEAPPDDGSVDKIVTSFGDASWGEPAAKNPLSGEYTDSEANGFILTKAVLVKASATCPTGVKHTNRIAIDKSSQNGSIELPLLKDVGELEIHAQSGSASSFRLEEYDGSTWNTIGIYNTIKENDSVYIIPLNKTVSTKLRIANNTGSILLIYQITTTTYKENQELNITGSTPAEAGFCYYNLTKTISLKFNKEVVLGSGDILLNDENIPVSLCTVDGKTATIPVVLEGLPNYKSYKLSIPKGAFLEKDNTSNLNNPATINFRTNKTIGYPENYKAEIDVVYSTANVDMNRLDIYYPETAEKPVPLLINIHGGGWNHGEKEAQSGFGSLFGMGMAVANIEYRMTPQATAPAAVVDARSAMMYLLENATKYNIDVNRIVFQGSSAGAHLALTAGYLQNDNRYDYNSSYSGDYKVVAVVDKYGPANVEKFLHYKSLVNWLGEYAEDVNFMRTVSPVHLVNSATTPPTYIVHGDADSIVEHEQSVFLSEALTAANIDFQFTTIPGGGHGGFTTAEYAQMETEITTFLYNILFKQTTDVNHNEGHRNVLVSVENGYIVVESDEEVVVSIFDISGKKILQTPNKRIKIDASGVFIVRVNSNSGAVSYKIVK